MARHLLIVICVLPFARVSLADDAQLRARFETEAPWSWARLEEMAQHLDIELVQRIIRPDSEYELKLSVKTSGENAAWSVKYVNVPEGDRLGGQQKLWCRNSGYAFALEKREASQPWFISRIGTRRELQHRFRPLAPWSMFSTTIYNRNVIEWFRTPEFTITDLEWADRPSGKLVAVTFKCAKPKDEQYWIHDGVVYLNPERLWAIQEFRFDATNYKGTEEHVTQVSKFRRDTGELPLAETGTMTAETTAGRIKVINNFNRFAHRQIPAEEFTLAAFERPEAKRSGSPVQVDVPVHYLGEVLTHTNHLISFAVRNTGNRPLQILGVSSGRGKGGSISSKSDEPRTIPAGQTSIIEVTYRAGSPGPFARSFEVYTDAPGRSKIKLTVTGESLPAGDPQAERDASEEGSPIDGN